MPLHASLEGNVEKKEEKKMKKRKRKRYNNIGQVLCVIF
jgi:hypothetical protein